VGGMAGRVKNAVESWVNLMEGCWWGEGDAESDPDFVVASTTRSLLVSVKVPELVEPSCVDPGAGACVAAVALLSAISRVSPSSRSPEKTQRQTKGSLESGGRHGKYANGAEQSAHPQISHSRTLASCPSSLP
jgi:hypothetical protein